MSKPEYGVNIHRIVNDEVEDLVDQYITADQAIDLMVHIQKNFPEAVDDADEEETEEIVEEEAVDEAIARRQRGPRKCSNCGREGHTARTCSRISLDDTPAKPANPPQPVGDNRSLREKVKELFDAGLAIEEVQDALPSHPMVEVGAIYRDFERRHAN